jgi:hypothetical protein
VSRDDRDQAEYVQGSHERVTPDHYPACPRCGDLCGVLATVCVGCGTRLVLNDDDRRTLGLRGGTGGAVIRHAAPPASPPSSTGPADA